MQYSKGIQKNKNAAHRVVEGYAARPMHNLGNNIYKQGIVRPNLHLLEVFHLGYFSSLALVDGAGER